jgi:transglutaminase-like putative cysteine protease
MNMQSARPAEAPFERPVRYRIEHATRYLYSEGVPLCQNELHIKPRNTSRQSCLTHRLYIEPSPQRVDECRDYFGNTIHFFTIQDKHHELLVDAHSEIELRPAASAPSGVTRPWEEIRQLMEQIPGASGSPVPSADELEAQQFVYDSPHVETCDELAAYARESFTAGRPWLEAMLDLMSRINREFAYDPTATSVSTPLETVMQMRRGVCQDFAHLQIGCLRSLGLPARYVSGYLLTTPPPGQPRLVGADASHAWLSVWYPGFGWMDLDPTNNTIPTLGHITVAWGRDYSDVCPIKGVFIGGGEHAMTVSVDVEPMAA